MKQAIISGLKKKLLLVEISGEKLSDEIIQIMNKHGIVEILGKLTDIKEEQFKEWVHSYPSMLVGSNIYYYKSYLSGGGLDTAKESFLSKLEQMEK